MISDTALVLGGEGRSFSRTLQTVRLHHIDKDIPIILSGCGWNREVPESVEMKQNLIHCGIPEEQIYTEEKSMDTIGNFVFSWPILEDLDVRGVVLITDDFHMDRGLWLADRILGDEFSVSPYAASRKSPQHTERVERIVKEALKFDFNLFGLERGNRESFEDYMRNKHPHADGSPPSVYGAICWYFRNFN